jgi:hypothetical protein
VLIVIIASTEGVGHLKFELSVASGSWASGRLDRGQLRKAKLSPNKGVGEAGLNRENSSANLVETKQVITCERRKVACLPCLCRGNLHLEKQTQQAGEETCRATYNTPSVPQASAWRKFRRRPPGVARGSTSTRRQGSFPSRY